MSYKTELQQNNADLQSLIDTANSLPDKENLDTELTEQDTLIADIMTALEGKTAGGSGSGSGSGGTSYPDGAFIPVANFTAGKQYALVAKIDGVYKYINTTTYNNYTMNATEVSVTQGSGYVTFGSEPALFTAAASGSGFTLANGSNYLHGTSSGGTALRVGTTTMVWTVDASVSGGFSDGKYLTKEDNSAVWLKYNDGTYDWSIKYETAGSFGYDREGRDNTYSTGFVSFILYEKAEGQSGGGTGGNSGIDTSDATATAADILTGKTAYVNNEKITGTLEKGVNLQTYSSTAIPTVTSELIGSNYWSCITFSIPNLKSTSTVVNFTALMRCAYNGTTRYWNFVMPADRGKTEPCVLGTEFSSQANWQTSYPYCYVQNGSLKFRFSTGIDNVNLFSISEITFCRAEWYDD